MKITSEVAPIIASRIKVTGKLQKDIPPMIIELLINYGACEKAGDGTSKHYFDKRSRRRLEAYAGNLTRLLMEYLNCHVVVCPEGRVITVAHRTERIRH